MGSSVTMGRGAVLWLAAVLLVLTWAGLLFVRWRNRQHIAASAATSDKRLELEISLDTELLKLAGGAVALVGLALTAVQLIDSRIRWANEIVTAREDRAYEMLAHGDDAVRVGGVYAIGDLASIDHGGEADRLRSLVAFGRGWSPYQTPRTLVCLAPGATRKPGWADDLKQPPSSPIGQAMQAVLNVLVRAGGTRSVPDLDLASTNLSRARLETANLSGAMLARADLSGAVMTDAILKHADLFCTNLFSARMQGVRAAFANLPGALLFDATIGPPSAKHAAGFNFATLNGADLRNAKLCGVKFRGAKLQDAALDGAVAYDANFTAADLTEATFQNAKLGGANLAGVIIRANALKPDLTCADLRSASVKPDDYCRAPDDKIRSVPAATLPDELRAHFTLCRTLFDSGPEDRDCPRDRQGNLPACLRDKLPDAAPDS